MKIAAELNYLRMSPRKVRLLADAIRGKDVLLAERVLRFVTKGAAGPLAKLLKSAVANARNNFQVPGSEQLVISEILVNEGPTLKRRRARAMGRAFPINKRTSHVRLVLESSGTAIAPKKVKKPSISVASSGDQKAEGQTLRPSPDRQAPKSRPKVATKTTEFVRRMFRRKAI